MWGADLSLEDRLALKPGGFFKIEQTEDGHIISVNIPGEPVIRVTCNSLGRANQLRMQLTDAGLTGFIEGAR